MAVIQWFPGHMARTLKIIEQSLKNIDVVIEVRDSRAPLATANPLIHECTSSKPRILILNKDDLADPRATRLWTEWLSDAERAVPLRVSVVKGRGVDSIGNLCRDQCRQASWLHRRPVRALITGIPNVGKSALINTLSRTGKAQTGARPGLTRDLHRIPVSSQLELFDTPGLLGHRFPDHITGVKVAALSGIKESILPQEDIVYPLLAYLARCYPRYLQDRYALERIIEDPQLLSEAIAKRRGAFISEGRIDIRRICTMLLKDLRDGRLGRISLEWPNGFGWPPH